MKNILKRSFFENDDVTIIMLPPSPPCSNTNPKWPVIVEWAFPNFSGAMWTENI